MNEIKVGTWRSLYEQARALREQAPWQWMYDTDLFGVENPQTSEVGYCCLMGRLGEFTGMALYRGRQGLASYERLQKANVDDPMLPPSVAFEQNCLMVSFNSRDELSSEEIQRIKSLDLKFRGRNHWPSFHDYSPGMVPWLIDQEDQAQFLLLAIKEAIQVAERCRVDQDLLDHVEDSAPCLLVRRQEEDGHWQNRWLPVNPYQPELPKVQVNRLFLRSNCQNLPQQPRPWLADVFYFPNPVQDYVEQRPYLPVMLIVVDQESGHIIGQGAFRPGELEQQLQEEFVQTIRSAGYLPERMVLPSLEAMGYFRQMAEELDIKLERENNPALLNEIKLSLFGSMSL